MIKLGIFRKSADELKMFYKQIEDDKTHAIKILHERILQQQQFTLVRTAVLREDINF
ncbi:MAG: hypothetical protein AAGC65_21955 [Mucilaginibacter sp.]|uniref:hypothetical protein n=1 Tax=Mucilaginibacter sp. TaxID=1882438 RepID=UPI0031B556F8